MSYLFEKKSRLSLIKGQFKSLFIQNSLERVSAKNRYHDYASMLSTTNEKLWNLHLTLEKIRVEATEKYEHYDYGNGYYYQSMDAVNISGYRDTSLRVEKLKLKERLQGKSVLDIGSNTGFVLLSIAEQIKFGVGVEFNPYLVETGIEVQRYLGITNVEQKTTSFENYQSDDKFDAILSLANHSTYDGNTQQSIETYFQKISDLLTPEGMLIFESHPPEIEPEDKLNATVSIIQNLFDVREKPEIKMPSFLDKNRTYIIATKK